MMIRMTDEVHAVLLAVGLPTLRVVADQADIATLEGHPDGKYTFAEVLRLASTPFSAMAAVARRRGTTRPCTWFAVRPTASGWGPSPRMMKLPRCCGACSLATRRPRLCC